VNGPYAVAPAVAYALVHALWQGALLAVIAAMCLSALRRHGAALRHAVGLGSLFAIAAVPVGTFALYRRASLRPLVGPAAALSGPVMPRGTDWLVFVVPAIWLAIAGALLVRQLDGWRQVASLASRGDTAPRGWLQRADKLRRALGISRPVMVRPRVAGTPFTARAWRPVVWLPAPLWARLPAAQQDALLAHELAHVRRLDWIWNGAQTALEALLWFHPAVWWLGRRVRQEREHACDDLAVATCGDAIALAEALATLERAHRADPRLALAAGGGALLERVSRLLVGAPAPVLRTRGRMGVLAIGGVLATQLALPRDVLIDLRVDASTTGPLKPGTYREITVDAFRMQHHYRGSMDERGRVREIYEEDGEPRPIDPGVRAWIDELVAVDARCCRARTKSPFFCGRLLID
jgi:Zn-dependent protease with chaperone function